MRLMIWVRDEGFADNEFRDGDVFQVHDDTWEPSPIESRFYLCVEVPNYANPGELLAPEYALGPSDEPEIRRMRKYRLNYAAKLTPEQLAVVKDVGVEVPVIIGLFTLADIARK